MKGGIQYNISGTWLLYSRHLSNGHTLTRTYHINEYKFAIHTYWTQKGRHFLYETLKCCGLLPEVEKGGSPCLM